MNYPLQAYSEGRYAAHVLHATQCPYSVVDQKEMFDAWWQGFNQRISEKNHD